MVDSTRNVKVPITDSEDELQIGFNYSDYAGRRWEHALEAVYVSFGNGHNDEKFGPLSIENAILVRDKLTEIIEEYEALRPATPKEPSSKEFWEAANVGLVAKNTNNHMIYTKISTTHISMVSQDGRDHLIEAIEFRDTYPGTAKSFEVLFEGVTSAAV